MLGIATALRTWFSAAPMAHQERAVGAVSGLAAHSEAMALRPLPEVKRTEVASGAADAKNQAQAHLREPRIAVCQGPRIQTVEFVPADRRALSIQSPAFDESETWDPARNGINP